MIDELSKQYEVESVDLNTDVTPGMYDALLAVQPSSLAPPQFERFMDAVRSGVPTAIFEDPAPTRPYITATGAPKQAGGGMFGGGGPQPKGEIRDLWEMLGIEVPGEANRQGLFDPDWVWQTYLPYEALRDNANPTWIFIDEDANQEEGRALSGDSLITSGMNEVLAIFSSAVKAIEGSSLTHTELLRTNQNSGLINAAKVREAQGQRGALERQLTPSDGEICIAMSIEGDAPPKPAAEGTEDSGVKPGKIKAVYVGDTDMMIEEFLMIRADPDTLTEARFQFQNVSFILNCIDWLTGQNAFIEVRKHEPNFPNLKLIDSVKDEARKEVNDQRRKYQSAFDEEDREAQEAQTRRLQEFREELEDLTRKYRQGEASRVEVQALQQKVQTKEREEQRRLAVKRQKLQTDLDNKVRKIEKQAQAKVTKIQNNYKAAAVLFPCIPPLLVGVIVFASRRLRERENIAKSRLK